MLEPRKMKIDSLRRQIEFLGTALDRHLLWLDDTLDPEIKQQHLELVDMLKKVQQKYQALLDTYEQDTGKEI